MSELCSQNKFDQNLITLGIFSHEIQKKDLKRILLTKIIFNCLTHNLTFITYKKKFFSLRM